MELKNLYPCCVGFQRLCDINFFCVLRQCIFVLCNDVVEAG